MNAHFITVLVPKNRLSLCCALSKTHTRTNPRINEDWTKEVCQKLLNELHSAPDSAIVIDTNQQKNRGSIEQLRTYMEEDNPGEEFTTDDAMAQAKDMIRSLTVRDLKSMIVGTHGDAAGVIMFEFKPVGFGGRNARKDAFYIKFAPPIGSMSENELEELYDAWKGEYNSWKEINEENNARYAQDVKTYGLRWKRDEQPYPYPMRQAPDWDTFWKANINRKNWDVFSFHDGHHMNENRI